MIETVETKVFDPAELFAQLSRLLALYLARAEDSDALANMAPKDALACAKTVMALMADLQGGKPAAVDEHTEWPRLEMRFPTGGAGVSIGGAGVSIGGAGVSPVIPPRRGTGPRPIGYPQSPAFSLEDAIVAVCNADEETQALEPWARLVARIDELCIHIQRDLDAWQQSDAERENDLGDDGADEEGAVVQPFRAGSSDEKTRAKALDYRENHRGSLPEDNGEDDDWAPRDNGEPPDESCTPTSFQLIESAGADEASENDNGNNTDFPARRNPRGP